MYTVTDVYGTAYISVRNFTSICPEILFRCKFFRPVTWFIARLGFVGSSWMKGFRVRLELENEGCSRQGSGVQDERPGGLGGSNLGEMIRDFYWSNMFPGRPSLALCLVFYTIHLDCTCVGFGRLQRTVFGW